MTHFSKTNALLDGISASIDYLDEIELATRHGFTGIESSDAKLCELAIKSLDRAKATLRDAIDAELRKGISE